MKWVTFLNFTLLTIIAVLGLQIITGMAGQISLGHSAFLMTGGYIMAILATKLGFPFWIAAFLAVLATASVGVLVALPAIRLKGFYVAVVTLAFFTISQHIFQNLSIAGGIWGLSNVPGPSVGPLKIITDTSWYYFLLLLTAICIIASASLARSRIGRSFLAVRDNEVTASGLGINVPGAKLRAFFIGSLFAGIAGVFWTSYVTAVRIDQFSLWDSIWYLGMIIIGGLGSTAGAVLGVLFLQLVRQVLHEITASGVVPLSINFSAALTFAVYGLAIILFIAFRPHGLMAVWQKLKTSYKRWPFGE